MTAKIYKQIRKMGFYVLPALPYAGKTASHETREVLLPWADDAQRQYSKKHTPKTSET